MRDFVKIQSSFYYLKEVANMQRVKQEDFNDSFIHILIQRVNKGYVLEGVHKDIKSKEF